MRGGSSTAPVGLRRDRLHLAPRRLSRGRPAAAIVLAAACAGVGQEFLLLDTIYTHTAGLGSLVSIAPRAGSPGDWTSPLDYSSGSVEFRLEILEKPSEAGMNVRVCLQQGGQTACGGPKHVFEPGVYTWSTPMAEWEASGTVQWAAGGLVPVLAVSDCDGIPIEAAGNNWSGAPFLGLYYPFTARASAVAVAAGRTFSGWTIEPARIAAKKSAGPARLWLRAAPVPAGETLDISVVNASGFPAVLAVLAPDGRQHVEWRGIPSGPRPWSAGWNLRPLRERPLPAGLYYLYLRAGNAQAVRKIILR